MFLNNFWMIGLVGIVLGLCFIFTRFVLSKYKFYKSLERYVVLVDLEMKFKRLSKEKKYLIKEYFTLVDTYQKYNIPCTMQDLLRSKSPQSYISKLSSQDIKDVLSLLKRSRIIDKKIANCIENQKVLHKLQSNILVKFLYS